MTTTAVKRASTELTRAFELAMTVNPKAVERGDDIRQHLTVNLEDELNSDSDFWDDDCEEYKTIDLALEMLGFDPKLV